MYCKTTFFVILCCSLLCNTMATVRKFPEGFKFGAATSSYQIEGGWNADGKGESIWDHLTHNHPNLIAEGRNADESANSYEFYKEDVKALNETKFKFYRFSISWARIMPTGDVSSLNEKGIDYYNRLINELIANGIEPMITMYHWDLPQYLQRLGGLVNPNFIEYFEQYAKVLFQRFGDRVPYWITFNEPLYICELGYGNGAFAPNVKTSGIGPYLVGKNILMAHARAYHLYQDEFADKYKGKITIAYSSRHFYSGGETPEDEALSDRALQFTLGWLANPIFIGDYPQIMIDTIAENSKKEGRQWSRLPVLSKEEVVYIKGTADFFALNYYTSRIVKPGLPNEVENPSLEADLNVSYIMHEKWPKSDIISWAYSVPDGLRRILGKVQKMYNPSEIIITENGWPERAGESLEDDQRCTFYKDHLEAVLDAIEDGAKVTGYTAWSIIDNFEWLFGYSARFGLYAVDFESPNKERTPKKSARLFKYLNEHGFLPSIEY